MSEEKPEHNLGLSPQEQRRLSQKRAYVQQIFAHPLEFMTSVFDLKDLPTGHEPEIAFAGRSNVGKSSLINFIFQKKGLARSSSTPGRTQSLNFFKIGDYMHVVDMPGYGYAKAPKAIVDAWNVMLRRYFLGRPQLQRVFVLIDSRHGLKANDVEILDMLDEAAVSYQIILTKIDKVKNSEVLKRVTEIEAEFHNHPAMYPKILTSSSEKNIGLEELRLAITDIMPT